MFEDDEDDDQDVDEEDVGGEDDGDGDDDEDGKGGGKKKLFLIIGILLLIAVGGVAGAYFTGLADPLLAMVGMGAPVDGAAAPAAEAKPAEPAVFMDLPEMLVNLNSSGRKKVYLKIRVALALAKAEDTVHVEQVMPRIVDNFQVYLRELRVDDLQGAAGMYRLREELLARVNAAAKPAKVNDVLFKEMLVQ